MLLIQPYLKLKQGALKKVNIKRALAVALEFKKMGLKAEDIAKGTGLSIEEIEKL